jgi:peptidoglycan/LPS O-acetylase OafA/YrhL
LRSPTSPAENGEVAAADEAADTDEGATESQTSSGLLFLLMLFPFFHHLWFLWFLCWLVVAFALYAAVAGRWQARVPNWLVVSRLRYLWLIPLTMLPQSGMGLLYPNFGPETSAGLVPIPQVLFYYAIFFFFGALYFDSNDDAGRLGQGWRVSLPIALFLVLPLGVELTTGAMGLGIQWIAPDLRRPLAVFLQVTYAWLMTFGLMGLFRSHMSRESKAMRYISDSSYWLYLAHLPLIIVAQAIVHGWSLPAIAKFTLVCVATSVLLLASYQLFVRYTPIGTLLNGPRVRPKQVVETTLAEAPAPP